MSLLNLHYDGTFEGVMTVVFDCFEQKWMPHSITSPMHRQQALFSDVREVLTDDHKSQRVLMGLAKRIDKTGINNLYKVFCSELPERELLLLAYCRVVFQTGFNVTKDYRNPHILRVSQIVKMINREIHRMHAFVRFQKTRDDIYAATIRPDFDVLSLAAHHFKDRYQDQQWLIYDTKRDYGMFYDMDEMRPITLTDPTWVARHQISDKLLADDEKKFQQMWKQYFDSTCIAERKNLRLHLKHVPQRYWRWLPEKSLQPIQEQ